MAGIFGMEALHNLASAAQAEQVEHIAAFDMYEQGLIAHVRDNMPQPASVQVPVPVMEPRVVRPAPLRLKVTPYNGKEGRTSSSGSERRSSLWKRRSSRTSDYVSLLRCPT
jgi:hypothetical protein